MSLENEKQETDNPRVVQGRDGRTAATSLDKKIEQTSPRERWATHEPEAQRAPPAPLAQGAWPRVHRASHSTRHIHVHVEPYGSLYSCTLAYGTAVLLAVLT